MRDDRLRVFFDGGCRPNPGPMELAVVARGVTYFLSDIGHGTNNDAEWIALIHGLKIAQSLEASDVELIGDSAMVVHQATGQWKCRGPDLQAHLATFKTLAMQFARVQVKHVKRSKNLAGIALARARTGL